MLKPMRTRLLFSTHLPMMSWMKRWSISSPRTAIRSDSCGCWKPAELHQTFISAAPLKAAEIWCRPRSPQMPPDQLIPLVMQAIAVDSSAIMFPFGAAHRLYFDTPPLKGYCRGTLVPCCETDESPEFTNLHVPCK
jgi:hypothetical protein